VAGREVAADGSTIPADASWEKKLNGAAAANQLRALDKVSRPVAEYFAALYAALPVTSDKPNPMDPKHISPTDPEAALTRKHGPARYPELRNSEPTADYATLAAVTEAGDRRA